MKKLLTVFLLFVSGWCVGQDQRIWATYYGGEGQEFARDIKTDTQGNIYIAGETQSTTGIASAGFQNTYGGGFYDLFVAKLDPNGNRLWATYYGGNGDEWSGYENVGIAIDLNGNVYLTGKTSSTSGISYNGFQNTFAGGESDAFLVKFNSSGNRLWATYYGGPYTDEGRDVAVDAQGNVYLAGTTTSLTGIASSGFQSSLAGVFDGFLVKLDSTGNRIWSTYYGGNHKDELTALATDVWGNVYGLGNTEASLSGIASGGFQNSFGGGTNDAFIVKFNTNGVRQWASYYGGNNWEWDADIATDPFGDIYIAGFSQSPSGIASPGGYQNIFGGTRDGFLAKFNGAGNRLWGTYYGINGLGIGCSVTTDLAGNVYLGGSSYYSTGIADNGFQNNLIGEANLFVAKFDTDGSRLCATYYGSDEEFGGYVYADNVGNLFMLGYTHASTGIAFNGFQNTYGGGNWDTFLVKFSSCNNNVMSVNTVQSNLACNGQCTGIAEALPANGVPPFTYLWSNAETSQEVSGLCAGTYLVTVSDSLENQATVSVIISEPEPLNVTSVVQNESCSGFQDGSISIFISNVIQPVQYYWSNSETNQSISNLSPGNYSVTITDGNNCQNVQYYTISEGINITLNITQNSDTLISTSAPNYQWYHNDTIIPGATSQNYVITESGNYYVVTTQNGCTLISNTIETSCLCVGIEENEFAKSILLYPNPATTTLTLSTELKIDNAQLKIINVIGQEVKQLSIVNYPLSIDISQLTPGLYYLTLQSAEGLATKKFEVIR